jgi:predicted DNA-binding transcriptional regulator AlpA
VLLPSPCDNDELVPDPQVQRELGITAMTLWRWTRDPALDFPPQIKIRNRNFRSRKQFEAFKQRMVRQAMSRRVVPERAAAAASSGKSV